MKELFQEYKHWLLFCLSLVLRLVGVFIAFVAAPVIGVFLAHYGMNILLAIVISILLFIFILFPLGMKLRAWAADKEPLTEV